LWLTIAAADDTTPTKCGRLNTDGSPETRFCCHEAPHGPCIAVLIGKVGTEWKDLTAKEGLLGFECACTGFVALDGQHGGFHDVCVPKRVFAASQRRNLRSDTLALRLSASCYLLSQWFV